MTDCGKDIKITIYCMALKRVSTCTDASQRGNQGMKLFHGGRFLSGGRGTCLGAVYVKYTVNPAITDTERTA